MADEALKSLTDLLETVPSWITKLEGILQSLKERQQEILFANQPAGTPVALSRKLSKSSSLLSKPSVHSEDEQHDRTGAEETRYEDQALRSQLPHMTPSDALRLAQRKRKTVSALSDVSGRPKFRSRATVIVYYDGDIQKQFESLVRTIGANRNALRKGKIVAKVDKLSRTSSGSSSEASSSEEQVPIRPSKLPYVTTRAVQVMDSSMGKDSTTEAFEKLDTLLEKAQALCEKAAHQVLRDGDCALEMRLATEHVVEVKKVAENEQPALQKRVARSHERENRDVEKEAVDQDAMDGLRPRSTPDILPRKVDNPFTSPGSLEVDLEADDSDEDEDVDFDVGALHMSRFGMRSTRSPALGAG